MHRRILRSRQCPYLRLTLPIAPRRKRMLDAREVLVIIRHPQRRNDLVAELLQFRREHSIKLRPQYLHRQAYVLDLAFLERR